jgi:hypothetical protein
MEIADGGLLRPEDVAGVWPLLCLVSGYVAIERGSETLEPDDLMKAIYITDLEHVSTFWDDWEGFERLVTRGRSGSGISEVYINRIVYLTRVELMARGTTADGFAPLGRPSGTFQKIVSAARNLASGRAGVPSTPSSRDLLFCASSQSSELSRVLQESGLQLEKLAAAVGK